MFSGNKQNKSEMKIPKILFIILQPLHCLEMVENMFPGQLDFPTKKLIFDTKRTKKKGKIMLHSSQGDPVEFIW